MTTGEAQRWGVERLSLVPPPLKSSTPLLDTTLILSCLLGMPRAYLIAHQDIPLGDKAGTFTRMIEERAKGLPVAYITGTKEFWGLSFRVTPDVLIPKPDTEILIEQALPLIRAAELRHRARSSVSEPYVPPRIADVCTGSGCIAVTLAYFCPGILAAASDISPKALAVARENARTILPPEQQSQVYFFEGDLMTPFLSPGTADALYARALLNGGERFAFDVITANPPYVPTNVTKELLKDGRSEPALALDGGEDGLSLIRTLIPQAFSLLVPGGTLILETGEYNAGETRELLSSAGFTDIVTVTDLAGSERITKGLKP